MSAAEARVDLRTDAEAKQLWERAAKLSGVPLAAFIKMAASREATEVINNHEALTLSEEESAWFLNLLRQPPAPATPAMRKAAKRRRELIGH